jgi:hypothetical protein
MQELLLIFFFFYVYLKGYKCNKKIKKLHLYYLKDIYVIFFITFIFFQMNTKKTSSIPLIQ